MRTSRRPIAIMRRSCSDSLLTASQSDGVFGSDTGMGVHVLLVTESMTREHFFNADGELLIVIEQGELRFLTEFGVIDIAPSEHGLSILLVGLRPGAHMREAQLLEGVIDRIVRHR